RPSGITRGGGGPGRPWRGWRIRLKEPGGSLPMRRRVSMPIASNARACASAWSTTPPPNDQEYGTTMPTFIRARLPPPHEQQADHRTGDDQLRLGGDADAVPASATVEELLAVQPDPGEDVLEVRRRARSAAEHGGVQEASPSGEEPQCEQTT